MHFGLGYIFRLSCAECHGDLKVIVSLLVIQQERADAAQKESEAAKSAWTCRVCISNEVDTIVVPCGHVLCHRCSAAVTRCPFCRRAVSKALRIYRP